VGSAGEPDRGRSSTSCQTIAGQLAMVRGRADLINRGDPNGGPYFYNMVNHTWSLRYQPSEYRVPKDIYDVIGGNGQGGATITSPANDKSFAEGLGKLFAAAVDRTSSPSPSTSPDPGRGGGSSTGSQTGAIAGGVVGGVVGLTAIGVGIWRYLRCHRKSTETGVHRHPIAPGYEESPPARYEMDIMPVQQPVHELDNTRGVQGGTHK